MLLAEADAVVGLATAAGISVATAESLTGGGLCAALVSVPGASECILGGVVAYAIEMKHSLLGVDSALLTDPGPVSREVAEQMATGARSTTGATMGIATTGVAGPEPHGGHTPGTVWVAVDLDGVRSARLLHLDGDRSQISSGAIVAALDLAQRVLEERVASA